MASSRKGKIDELYDLAAIEAQQAKVIALVGDLVKTIGDVKPITVKLEGTEKTKEVIEGVRAVSEANQKVAETSKTAVNEMGKLVDMSSKVAGSYEQQANLITKFAGTLDQNIKLQTQYKLRLDEIKGSMADLKKQYEIGTLSAKGYQKASADLVKEQLTLQAASKELGFTIRAQVKENIAAENSYDALNQRVGLLRDSYRQLTEERRNGQEGRELMAQIIPLDQKLKELDAGIGNFQRNIGNYSGTFSGAFNVLEKEIGQVALQLNSGKFTGKELDDLIKKQTALNSVTALVGKNFNTTAAESNAFKEASTQLGLVYGSNHEVFKNFKTEVEAGKGKIDSLNKTVKEGTEASTKFGGSFSKVYSGFRQLANIIPGIGLSGLILLLLGPLQAAGEKIITFLVKTKDKAEKLAQSIRDAGNEIAVQAAKDSAKDIGKLELLRSVLTNLQKPLSERNNALKEYNKIADDGNKISEKEINNIAAINNSITAQIDMIKQRGLARAAETIIAQRAEDYLVKLEKAREKSLEQVEAREKAGLTLKVNKGGAAAQAYVDAIEKRGAVEQEAANSPEVKEAKQKMEDAITSSLQFNLDFTDPKTKTKAGKDNAKTEFKFLEDARKALFEAQKIRLQNEVDADQKIVENDKVFFNRRLEAVQAFYTDRLALIELQKKYDLEDVDAKEAENVRVATKEKQGADVILQIHKAASAQRGLIQEKANADILKLNSDSEKQITDLVKSNQEDRKKVREKETADNIDIAQGQLEYALFEIETNANSQLKLEAKRYADGKINKEQYEQSKLEIENKARKESLLAEIAYYEKLLKIANVPEDKKKEALKKLEELRKQVLKEEVKDEQLTADEKVKIRERMNEKLKDLGNEAKETVFSLLYAGVEREKNQVQEQIDALEAKKQKDIEVANQTILNATDKANAIAVIEARAQAQREQLEKRQRELQQQRAKYEKAKSILDIIENTTIAVVGALRPDGFTPLPARIALAAVIGAIGAAQLARVIATPIPKYKEGTTDHPGGLAVVGDGGKVEYVHTPDDHIYKTPASDTLVDIPARSKVYKNEQALMNAMASRNWNRTMSIETNNSYFSDKNITKSIDNGFKSLEKTIKNQPQPIYETPSKIKGWVHGYNETRYLR